MIQVPQTQVTINESIENLMSSYVILHKTHDRINDIYLVTRAVLKILKVAEDDKDNIRISCNEKNIDRFKRDLARLDEMTAIYEYIVPHMELVRSLFPDFYKSDLMTRLFIHKAANDAKKNK